MKKVTVFVGSAHRKNTFQAAQQFCNNLKALGDVETDIVILSNYKLGVCRGCRVCFEKGEAFCPLKDDRDLLFDKIAASDGVVFATPNYAWDMSGMMKVFLDRFGFAIHRPRYFGKVCTSIVTQAAGRGEKIVEYFDFAASTLGFKTLKGITITAFDPRTAKQQEKIDRDLAQLSKNFYKLLSRPADAPPSLYQLMVFRFGRNMVRRQAPPDGLDYHYFAEKGWFTSDYFYPTQMSSLMKAAGYFMDRMTAIIQMMM